MIGKLCGDIRQSSNVDMNEWTNIVRILVFVFLSNVAPSRPQTVEETLLTKEVSLSNDTAPSYLYANSAIGYAQPCGLQRHESARIVGGSNAAPGEFPWQASVQLLSGRTARHVCGGAVISAYWVVTAAHCVQGLKPRNLSVVAGDYDLYSDDGGEQRVYVVRVLTPGFSAATFSRDLALLQLHAALSLDGRRVAAVCLPRAGTSPAAGVEAVVSGWGRLGERGALPRVLQRARLPLVEPVLCRRQLRQAGFSLYLGPCQLCGGVDDGGVDACQGDSGGPLVCRHSDGRFYLCGIVSWGVGCGRPGLPGIYTDISCYSNWISTVLYGKAALSA